MSLSDDYCTVDIGQPEIIYDLNSVDNCTIVFVFTDDRPKDLVIDCHLMCHGYIDMDKYI